MDKRKASFLKLSASMVIFGSIGLFVKNIPLQSSLIAMFRAITGVIFLAFVMLVKRQRLSAGSMKRNTVWLCLSGIAIGFNWILLFESYRYTSVAVSTMCYYMAPIFVVLLSPILLKELMTVKKFVCVFAAMIGMVFISGVLSINMQETLNEKGILYGIGAALLYASVILMNKKLKQISAFDKTIVQLAIAALILIPYNLLTADCSTIIVTPVSLVLLFVVGIVHTGLAYFLYFDSMEWLSGQSIAVCSYIDPVIAVLASVIILREHFGLMEGIGAVLILGAALVSELPIKRKEAK